MAPSKRVRQPRISDSRDGAAEKRCPTGLTNTILSIQKYWLHTLGIKTKKDPPLDHEAFVAESEFEKCWLDIIDNIFPGVAKPARHDIADAVYEMARGNTDMEYYRIRAFSKFIELRPVGLFLLFTQLVGLEQEERKKPDGGNPREACLKLIGSVSRVMAATEEYLNSRPPSELVFHRRYHEGHLPDMTLLKAWSDALKDSE